MGARARGVVFTGAAGKEFAFCDTPNQASFIKMAPGTVFKGTVALCAPRRAGLGWSLTLQGKYIDEQITYFSKTSETAFASLGKRGFSIGFLLTVVYSQSK